MKRVALIVVMTLVVFTSLAGDDDDFPADGCECNEGYISICSQKDTCENPEFCCEKNEVPIVRWQLFLLAGAGMVMAALYMYKRAKVLETEA